MGAGRRPLLAAGGQEGKPTSGCGSAAQTPGTERFSPDAEPSLSLSAASAVAFFILVPSDTFLKPLMEMFVDTLLMQLCAESLKETAASPLLQRLRHRNKTQFMTDSEV